MFSLGYLIQVQLGVVMGVALTRGRQYTGNILKCMKCVSNTHFTKQSSFGACAVQIVGVV